MQLPRPSAHGISGVGCIARLRTYRDFPGFVTPFARVFASPSRARRLRHPERREGSRRFERRGFFAFGSE